MKIPRHVLAEAMAKKTLEMNDSKLLANEIAAYLMTENRVSEIEPIVRDIMQYRQDHGILEAEAVSAHEITDHVTDEVKQLLHAAYPNAKSIKIVKRQDPSVIGGLRVDMANEQLDMTVQSKLATFKRITA